MIRNKRDLKSFVSELNRIQESIHQFSEDSFNQEINDVLERMKINEGAEKLKSMPMDVISTLEKGLPINLLVNNGFRTIYDIVNHEPEELMQMDGIGEKSAYSIYNAVSRIKESVYQQAIPRINPDKVSNEGINLLESIYNKWQLLKVIEEFKADFNQFKDAITPDIETAKKQKHMIGSLFQSRAEKEKIKLAYENLNQEKNKKNLNNIKEKLNEILHFSVNKEELIQHFVRENASYYTEIEKVTGAAHIESLENLPTDFVDKVNQYTLDVTDLNVTLRGYQEFGAKYALYHKRTLLGDEMGLGKTIQGLAIINHLFQNNQKYTMVVCPLSVVANWNREIHQRSKLHTYIFHGPKRDEEFAKWQANSGVLITTYEQTLRMNFEEEHQLDTLIVDEAHYVKNPEAKRSQSIYKLADMAEYVLFMSGTPLENRLEEMKQLISILQPDIAEKLSNELYLLQPHEFKQAVAPVYLRRNRKDVLCELPELEIIPQWMDFAEKEERYYKQAVMEGKLMSMRRAAWQGGSPEHSPKLEKLLDICDAAAENGHKVLVFSFFRSVIHTIQQHLKGRTFEAITGDVPIARRQEIIDVFTNAHPGSVLLSQITAGGVGLNIQAANIVILCEPQWKPSTEEQAISRAYRMGQSRNVIVYRLLTEDSIDVTMLEVLGEKANLFDLYARESDVASLALNKQEEAEESIKQKVLNLEKERIQRKVGESLESLI
ncbi:DEAD/DEAH box helicase [Bacillus sp. FJAT-49711]|uniref:DEAD/DEAH box helicase n=1 Tax=Bacillus sp. FJAT-49711 TaxID=2833585 RepID=UPI001BC93871|nr:DEAD/DEAH box helicase [Bacillus sp. FJAT-49711]MBS4217507.1 DEAD/DEAH box helicase [Bacillus sp. FJAT-49711]